MARFEWRWRMLVSGTFRERWIEATPEMRAAIFASWIAVHRQWQDRGCRLIATMDNATIAGRADGGNVNFYTLWEIPDPRVVRELLDLVWDEEGESPLRLAEYFTLSTTIGKPILTMESELGGPLPATAPIASS